MRTVSAPISAMPGFTGGMLDRADHLRLDQDALDAAVRDQNARFMALNGLDPVVDAHGCLVWRTLTETKTDTDIGADDALILLGLDEGKPHFAVLPPGSVVGNPDPRALWGIIETMPSSDAASYATARSLIDWHARHLYCAKCGAQTSFWRAGWGRSCVTCNAEHYPRVDPVVIMLAEHDGRVLVGRQPRYPRGRYSALAGFLEPGESIEEAVARELFEEAGVRATSVRYIASQPWPFPSSLMMACIAPVENDALTLDATEIEDAFWVTREEVAAAMAEEPDACFIAPPRIAIANTLFRHWLDGA
jgi:NAD+ diphosphatase